MREDLLKIIRQHEEVTNAIVLTHNIDFVFVQTMVLAALRKCGHPTFTVFADAQCAADSYAHQQQVIDGLGTRYRVVPVEMRPGFRFHPKALLLSGPSKGTLLVGSGNLTFGGWRENAEVWLRFETDSGELGPFVAFHRYLDRILDKVPIPEPVKFEIDEAFDAKTREWASRNAEPDGLLARIDGPDSLIDQIMWTLKDTTAERLTVCSPYYDKGGEALAILIDNVSAPLSQVLVQPKQTKLYQPMIARVQGKVELVTADFQHRKHDGTTRSAFIHAKFYAVDSQGQTTAFVGSANCSRAALTIAGKAGNAELLAVQQVPTADFEEQVLGELNVSTKSPKLEELAEIPDSDQDKDSAPIRVLAARFDSGKLHVAFTCLDLLTVTSSFVDDLRCDIEIIKPGLARVKLGHRPRTIQLEGALEGELVRSKASWVDHEYDLRSTSRGRGLVDSIRNNIQPGAWDIKAWSDVGDVFFKHLQYMPTRSSFGIGRSVQSQGLTDEISEYRAEDVFSTSYGATKLSKVHVLLATNRDNRINSLQQMLLSWFGVQFYDSDEDSVDFDNKENEDGVDKPEKMPELEKRELRPVKDRDRKRAKRIIDKIATAMTTEQFLEYRSPELLAADLQVTAVLLRTGLMERWITEEKFFETTHKIWKSLFFSCNPDANIGWLQYRYEEADSRDEFVERMSSVALSAALLAWALAVHPRVETAEHSLFVLSWILSIARLPWLWKGGNSEEIAEALIDVFNNTVDYSEEEIKTALEVAGGRWVKMMKCGQTLRALEEVLGGCTPSDLRQYILQDDVEAGELLWQGDHGFCVSKTHCKRQEIMKATVYRLQGEAQEVRYQADYLIPLRGLVASEYIKSSTNISDDARMELLSFLEDLQKSI